MTTYRVIVNGGEPQIVDEDTISGAITRAIGVFGLISDNVHSLSVEAVGAGEPTADDEDDDYTPAQLAELRQEFDAWLAARRVPEAVRRMLAPWQFTGSPQREG